LDTRDETKRIPVVRERIDIDRRSVETGRVRVRKEVRERIARVEAPVVKDRVRVERVAVGREVDPHDPPRTREEDDVLVIPVLEEVLVVERRLMLREELRVIRSREETSVVQEVPLTEEHVVVERVREDDDVNPEIPSTSNER
jgi:uncharacterized protein (TIGR02271 family)